MFRRSSSVAPVIELDKLIESYHRDRNNGKDLTSVRKSIIDSIPDYTYDKLVNSKYVVVGDVPFIELAAFRWEDHLIVDAILKQIKQAVEFGEFKLRYGDALCDSHSENIQMIAEQHGLCRQGGSLRFRKRFNTFTNRKKPVHVQSIKRNKRKPLQKRQSRKK